MKTLLVVVHLACLLLVATGLQGCNNAQRKQLPPKEAWKAMNDEAIFGKIVDSVTGQALVSQQIERERTNAENIARRTTIPTQAFDEIVDELSQRLATDLPAMAKERFKGEGGVKIALAVGRFRDSTKLDEPELRSALKQAASRLNRNAAFTTYVDLIQYSVEDADSMIKEIGGGKDDWARPDGSNSVIIDTKTYHPDLIYVLDGELFYRSDVMEDEYKKTFTANIAITHPRSRTASNGLSFDFKRSYTYHPARKEWMSQAAVDELQANYDRRK